MKREVGQEHVSQERVSMMLRSLPPRVPLGEFATSLRVIASRERQRRIERRGLGHMCVSWLDRTRLTLQDILRPLALPAAGGLFSAVVLFSMWVVPTYPLRAKSANDIPTNLTTSASQDFACSYCYVEAVKGAVAVGLTESLLVEIDVDDQGRMVDYQVVSGASVLSDPRTRSRLENLLLFTQFAPATSFGMPIAGKARLLLLPSRIDVKG
jgi:hypothetical protein